MSYATDSWNMDTATWVRYVNMARWPSELNVGVAICKGRVYYFTIKDIAPGKELLTYYGDMYAQDLGLDHTAFWFWTKDGARRFNLGIYGVVVVHDESGNMIREN